MKLYFAIDASSKNDIKWCEEGGVERALISYANVQGKARLKLPFKDIMLDSGAYSVATGVDKISLEAYALWLQIYRTDYPQIRTYINLDDLDDPDKSLANLKFMENKGLRPIPVYHYGEPEDLLKYLCSKYDYIGLGGLAVGTMPSVTLERFWNWIHDAYPEHKFHILGVGTMKPFYHAQPFSMDSTSWKAHARYGVLMGYRHGLPAQMDELKENNGCKLFFKYEDYCRHNIQAQLDWEKLEWLNNIKKKDHKQVKLL